MSLRLIGCFLFVVGFSLYAYRNWFPSLCATIFLMAFVKHPDMPRSILGIPGMNLWNLLMGNVILAWLIQRRYEDPLDDTPRSMKIAVRLYLAVIVVSFLRLFIDPTNYFSFYPGLGRSEIFVDFLMNSLRLLVPAYLLYKGCQTKERITWALGTIVVMYFLLAVQVVRYMGLNPDWSGSDMSGRAARIIEKSVGYDRVDMSMMLAGGSWAAIAVSALIEKKWLRWSFRGMALVIVLGQALTGGRAGYVTWCGIGLVLCTLRWRRILPLIPIGAIAVLVFVPGVSERMFSGFGGKNEGVVVEQNDAEITSGRNLVWPVVINKIKEAPLFGFGRQGMVQSKTAQWVAENLNDSFPHPHEAYLEMLLDNGIIGFLCVMPIFVMALRRSGGLFLDHADPIYEAAGGAAMALSLALFLAAFGAQTLYPREGVVGMWAAIGIALRVSVERARREAGEPAFGVDMPVSEAEIVEEPDFANEPQPA